MGDMQEVDFLYKYRDFKDREKLDRIERIFSHGEIYFPSPLKFNDPFDCKPNFSFNASNAAIERYIKGRLDKYLIGENRQQKRIARKEFRKKLKNVLHLNEHAEHYQNCEFTILSDF